MTVTPRQVSLCYDIQNMIILSYVRHLFNHVIHSRHDLTFVKNKPLSALQGIPGNDQELVFTVVIFIYIFWSYIHLNGCKYIYF